MKFMVLAWDRPGEEGEAQRDALRASHGETITARFHAGEALFGAGIYDDEGVVRGSIIIFDFPTRADVEAYLETEPFQTAGLWERVEIHELKVPDMYVERMGPTPKD